MPCWPRAVAIGTSGEATRLICAPVLAPTHTHAVLAMQLYRYVPGLRPRCGWAWPSPFACIGREVWDAVWLDTQEKNTQVSRCAAAGGHWGFRGLRVEGNREKQGCTYGKIKF